MVDGACNEEEWEEPTVFNSTALLVCGGGVWWGFWCGWIRIAEHQAPPGLRENRCVIHTESGYCHHGCMPEVSSADNDIVVICCPCLVSRKKRTSHKFGALDRNTTKTLLWIASIIMLVFNNYLKPIPHLIGKHLLRPLYSADTGLGTKIAELIKIWPLWRPHNVVFSMRSVWTFAFHAPKSSTWMWTQTPFLPCVAWVRNEKRHKVFGKRKTEIQTHSINWQQLHVFPIFSA